MHIVESRPSGRRHRRSASGPPARSAATCITFDMGGTTAKASIIEDGQLQPAPEYEVGGGINLGQR